MQLELFRGKCRSCSSPVSHFALRCPHCGGPNQPNPVVTIAALAGALVTGAVVVGSAFLMGASGRSRIRLRRPPRRAPTARLPRRPPAMTAANTPGLFKRCPDATSRPSGTLTRCTFSSCRSRPLGSSIQAVAGPDRRCRHVGQALKLVGRARRAAQPRAHNLSEAADLCG